MFFWFVVHYSSLNQNLILCCHLTETTNSIFVVFSLFKSKPLFGFTHRPNLLLISQVMHRI